jgi:hypothetical protein
MRSRVRRADRDDMSEVLRGEQRTKQNRTPAVD